MKQVVGAAIIRHGEVMAARRTSPSSIAGRWELPGGKVEAGESPAAALVREIEEEFGIEVTVDGWLAGVARIDDELELRVARCSLVNGEPTPREHDQVRWLIPETLDEVDWLDSDRGFLPELTEILLDGFHLSGGRVGGAVRIGDTVRRPGGPWTEAVQAFLAHLDGLPCVPRPLGRDVRGRDTCDYLPGTVIDPETELLSDAQLVEVGQWLRLFHDRSEGWHHPGPWRFFGVLEESMIIGHNDVSPNNVCWDDEGHLSGVFDWDLSGPTTRLMGLSQLTWTGVPFAREIPAADAARRLKLLAEAYGLYSPIVMLDGVEKRVHVAIDGIREACRRGDEGMRSLAALGEPEATEERLSAFLARRAAIESEF